MTYPTQFNQAVETVLVDSGILVAPGYGVSVELLSEARGFEVTEEDVARLTREEAIAIYHKIFWLKSRIFQISNEVEQREAFATAIRERLGY